jgi:predicted ArsR family transcriptional regulator
MLRIGSAEGFYGDDVTVERTQHLIAGDQRCAYLVRPR